MPIYRIRCEQCGAEDEVIRKLADYDDLPEHCGHRMLRMVSAPMLAVDLPPYKSMATGEMIQGRREHREHLRKNGLIEVGNEPIKPLVSRGDHNVKRELVDAVKQHLGH